eukprot:Rmarinus@m.16594
MSTPQDVVAQAVSTKHSWKGKYKRILAVSPRGILTLDQNSFRVDAGFDVTNNFGFKSGDEPLVSLNPTDSQPFGINLAHMDSGNFLTRKGSLLSSIVGGGKEKQLLFACESNAERAWFLSEAHRYRMKAEVAHDVSHEFEMRGYKVNRTGQKRPVGFHVKTCWMEEVSPGGTVVAEYEYRHISAVGGVVGDPPSLYIKYGPRNRLHMISSECRQKLYPAIVDFAKKYLGVAVQRAPDITIDEFLKKRSGDFSSEADAAPFAQYKVSKHSKRAGPMPRLLSLTDRVIVERDPSNYAVINIQAYVDVHAIVRDADEPQMFTIETKMGQRRTYSSVHRETLLANVVHCVTKLRENVEGELVSVRSDPGLRCSPWMCAIPPDVIVLYVKALAKAVGVEAAREREKRGIGAQLDLTDPSMRRLVAEFNANVPWGGVPPELTPSNMSKLCSQVFCGLLGASTTCTTSSSTSDPAAMELDIRVGVLRVARRLVATFGGFSTFVQAPGAVQTLWRELTSKDEAAAFYAADVIRRLVHPPQGSNTESAVRTNKRVLFEHSSHVTAMVSLLGRHALMGTGTLLVWEITDILCAALCAPNSATTETEHFHTILTLCAGLGRALFRLFRHDCKPVSQRAAALMKVISEFAKPEVLTSMQYGSLVEGAFLHHLHRSLYAEETKERAASMELVALWAADNKDARQLLKRVFPAGLVQYLSYNHADDRKRKHRKSVSLQSMFVAAQNTMQNQVPVPDQAHIAMHSPSRPQALPSSPGQGPPHTPQHQQSPHSHQHHPSPQQARAPQGSPHPHPQMPHPHQQPPQQPQQPPRQHTPVQPSPQASPGQPQRMTPQQQQRHPQQPYAQSPQGHSPHQRQPAYASPQAHQPPPQAGVPSPQPQQSPHQQQPHPGAPMQSPQRQPSQAHHPQQPGGPPQQPQQPQQSPQEPSTALAVAGNRNTMQLHGGAGGGDAGGGTQQQKPAKESAVGAVRRAAPTTPPNNFPLFFSQFSQDAERSDLIWNSKTRSELREALIAEIRALEHAQDAAGTTLVSWNHLCFRVSYPSLAKELRIGDTYLRPLLHDPERSTIINPVDLFGRLYHRLLVETDKDLKDMCVRALAIVYERHMHTIGPVYGVATVVQMLKNERNRTLRDRLLTFLSHVVCREDNAKDFMESGGVTVVVGLLTLVHLDKDRTTVPLQSNLLMSADHGKPVEEPEEIFYGDSAGKRQGPFSLSKIGQLYQDGTIKDTTKIWSQGMKEWETLETNAQVKESFLMEGSALMSYTERGLLCMDILYRLCNIHPSKDKDGALFRPIPTEKRLLSSGDCLPHLVQVLLTNDPPLVDASARLLTEIVRDNPVAMPKLYLTGLFFFALTYTGSNFRTVAALLKVSHAQQRFKEDEGAVELVRKSILSGLLPDAMVCFLQNHKPDKFCEIYLGNFDTPEAIWNNDMRLHMIQAICLHLGDFSMRLQHNPAAMFEYCPCPPVHYRELDAELFCDIFYLRNLCDKTRFPDWPIDEPVRLMQALLKTWGRTLEEARNPTMSEGDALETLGLAGSKTLSDAEIRRAYRKVAMKYHPDKNPDGRDMFEKITKAYEVVSSKRASMNGPGGGAGGGGGAGTPGGAEAALPLLLRAQIILFSEHSKKLAPYKYAGYPYLLEAIKAGLEENAKWTETGENVELGAKLCRLSVECTSLNADELHREDGVKVLAAMIHKCLEMCTKQTTDPDARAIVATDLFLSLAVGCEYEGCRDMILKEETILQDTCYAITLQKNLPFLANAAISFVAAAACDSRLQDAFYQLGILWHLLLPCFEYDYSLEDGGVEASDETNTQQLLNTRAKLCAKALARLGGYIRADRTPAHQEVKASLVQLLTLTLAKKLDVPTTFLRDVNTNTESATLIWNGETRSELTDFLETQLKARMAGQKNADAAKTFEFKCHKGELQVCGIYLRIYNRNAKSTSVEDPRHFMDELVSFLSGNPGKEKVQGGVGLNNGDSTVALQAVSNCLGAHGGAITSITPQAVVMIAGYTDEGHSQETRAAALDALDAVTHSAPHAKSLTDSPGLATVLLVLPRYPATRLGALKVANAIAGTTQFIPRLEACGLLPYTLLVLMEEKEEVGANDVRKQACSVLSRCLVDRMHGERFSIQLSRLLPGSIVAALRSDPAAVPLQLDRNHENPDLVWNKKTREQLLAQLRGLSSEFCAKQAADKSAKFLLPDTFKLDYLSDKGELVVGGVYIRLFLKDPSYQLRDPRGFMVALCEHTINQASKPDVTEEELTSLSVAVVALFHNNAVLLDQAAHLGYVKRAFSIMTSAGKARPASQEAFLRFVHTVAASKACVHKMEDAQCLASLKSVMEPLPNIIALAAETVDRVAQHGCPGVVAQAFQCDFVPFLLSLLELNTDKLNEAAQTKARVVSALKAFAAEPVHGSRVLEILDNSPVWKRFKDQRHDLFLTSGKDEYGHAMLTAGPVVKQRMLTESPADSPEKSSSPASRPAGTGGYDINNTPPPL